MKPRSSAFGVEMELTGAEVREAIIQWLISKNIEVAASAEVNVTVEECQMNYFGEPQGATVQMPDGNES